jgi:2-keto-4-pentenoate hydratase
MKNDTWGEFAAALASARKRGRYARDVAREPKDLAQAFAAQAAVARALGATVGGWKVGFAADGTPVAAPMYDADVRRGGARFAFPAGAPVIVEAELALRLARHLPPRSHPYARAEILAAVDAACVGIELIHGRVGESKDVPFPVWLADNMGNAGYAAGTPVRDFAKLDLAALRCRLRIGRDIVHDRIGGHPQQDPVEPLRAWASAQRDALGGLRAGQLVTTGSLSGSTTVLLAGPMMAEISGIGSVELTLAR